MIGHKGHPEVEGTMGQGDCGMHLVEAIENVDQLVVKNPAKLAYVTQTTLSVDDAASIVTALQRRFPEISGPRKDDICYATQSRQDAVKRMAGACDVVVVVGSNNSSNSRRLREVAERFGLRAWLVDDADALRREWFSETDRVGITAGASAPENLVSAVVAKLQSWYPEVKVASFGTAEDVAFSIPAELRE
jgi:4-hydroxy-3-methylbut-2-enyl diphosphate reductase